MEFVIRWKEEVHAGNVTVNGSMGTYIVNIPIAVDQVSSQDLGCDTQKQTPTGIIQNQEIIMPDAPLYDDFESVDASISKWGQPVWDNPQQYTPIQSQGTLRFEIGTDWFDWAVKQSQSIEEIYALVTLDSANDGAFGITLRTISVPGTGYNIMLKKDHVSIWNDPRELGDFQVGDTCCPYTHLLGIKSDGTQLHFYVDNQLIGSYPFNGYPDYATLQIAGATRTAASVSDVWIKFRP
jgi:hypothetical protein